MIRFSTLSHLVCTFFFGLLATSFTAHAHLFKAQKWSSKNQDLLLVSDFHRSTTAANQCQIQQRQEIVDFAAQTGAGVIVEDGMIYGDAIVRSLSVYIEQGIFPASILKTKAIEIPLHGMHSLCSAQGVDSINAEYRFSQCRALNVYYEFFQNKKNQLLSHSSDGAEHQAYYARTISALENDIEKPLAPIFSLFKNKTCTLGEFLKNSQLPIINGIDQLMKKIAPQWNLASASYKDKIEILLTNYTIAFLDMEIIHALSVFKDKKLVIVCAGNHHIDNITSVLPQLGFTQQQSIGQELRMSNGVKYIEPQAIQAWTTLASMTPPEQSKRPENYFNSFLADSAFKFMETFYA